MARTAHLTALRRIARVHARHDLPQGRRSHLDGGGARRRDPAAGTGGDGAATAGSPADVTLARPAPARGDDQPRIAIIGAGLAGLAAALTLQDNHLYADIYESSGRIGGRVFSDWTWFEKDYWTDGQQAELGAELIDSDHQTILDLARRFTLTVVDLEAAQPAGTTDTYYVDGGRYSVDQATADFQPVWSTLQRQLDEIGRDEFVWYKHFNGAGQRYDYMSVFEWILQYVPGGVSSRLGAMLNAAYDEEFGAETSGQSSLNLIGLLGNGTSSSPIEVLGLSDQRYHIAGGNSLLPLAIANALPSTSIHCGYAMTSIAVNGDGSIGVSFSNGESITADEVILALPFAVLRNLDYSQASFDSLKQTAITDLGAGRNVKLSMQFTSRIWTETASDGSLYTDLPICAGWEVTRGQDGLSGIWIEYPGAKVSFSMGQPGAYETTSTSGAVTNLALRGLAQLEDVYPGITGQWNGKAMISTPFTDPNFLLSYAYWKPGQYTTFAGYEGVRQGNIHFAGEHCSLNYQGFMEGAAQEGIRAAGEIIGDIKQ